MTNKEAIDWLIQFQNNLLKEMNPSDERVSLALCATLKAIKALEQVSIADLQKGETYELNKH